MTCVVALKTHNTVILGADSFCGNDEVSDLCHKPKVYKVGSLGVGICGQVRAEQILEKTLKKVIPPQEEVEPITEDWLLFSLPNILRKAMKKHEVLVENEGSFEMGDSEYMFVFQNDIYYLDENFGIWKTKRNYGAIGSGKQYALGALAALENKTVGFDNPSNAVKIALKAAATWSPWVREPFITLSV